VDLDKAGAHQAAADVELLAGGAEASSDGGDASLVDADVEKGREASMPAFL
jgi:hypothetical protein